MKYTIYFFTLIFCFNYATGQDKLELKKAGFLKLKKEYFLGGNEIDKGTFYDRLDKNAISAIESKRSTLLNYSSAGLLASAYIVQILVQNKEFNAAISSGDFTRYNNLSVLNGMMYNLSFYGFAQASHSRSRAIAAYNNEGLPKQKLFITAGLGYPPYSFITSDKPQKEFTTMSPALTLGVQYLINQRNYGYAKVYGLQEIDYNDGTVSYNARSTAYNIGFGTYFLENAKLNGFAEAGIGMSYLDTKLNGYDLLLINDQNIEATGMIRLGLSSSIENPWVFDASAGLGFLLPTFEISIHRKLF